MLSSLEDHQSFVQLIQQSSMFHTLVNKIGSRLITSDGKKSGIADMFCKINKSQSNFIDQDSYQDSLNQSSSVEEEEATSN